MKEILKLGGILLLITAVCSGLLGLVSNITTPLIAERKEATTKQAIQSLLPEANEVIQVSEIESTEIMEIYKTSKDGEYIGSVAKVAPNGYGGAIELLVGVDKEEKVTGIQILAHAETPGLGANMDSESFRSQFVGKMAGMSVVKGQNGENEISAITGATITSQAVVTGVNTVIDYVEEYKEALMKEGE